jgi:UDP-N-acetylmuramoylalanine--D-glutamate ligase
MKTWNGQRVLILGAARQGQALARFLSQRGALVTLSDQKPADQMKFIQESLGALPVTLALGGHPLTLLDDIDLLCLSGGIPLTLPIVIDAQRRGIPLSNDSQIFLEAVGCRVIGITGSAGKTTTTTLVGRMAEAALGENLKLSSTPHKNWVGGNIGLPLIEYLDEIGAGDTVILELSSFQLEQMTLSPQVAAILNITPNHLDRHGTMQAYTTAKQRILTYQAATDVAVLGRDDPGAWGLVSQVQGKLISFGLEQPEKGLAGTFCRSGWLYLQDDSAEVELMEQSSILLRGEHNLLNVLAACAIAWAAGFPVDAMREGVLGFTGVPHRLELVRQYRGTDWYNDSIATAPERSIAAIQSFSEPLVLLLGGRDKNLPWQELAEMIHQRVDHVVVFGEASEKILKALGPVEYGKRPFTISHCHGLQEAIHSAASVIEPGDVVLLSPGGVSFDEFSDYTQRGESFRLWVNQL